MWSDRGLRRAGAAAAVVVALATLPAGPPAGTQRAGGGGRPVEALAGEAVVGRGGAPDAAADGGTVATLVLDVFDASSSEVSRARAAGQPVVCLVRAAVWEPWRPDAARFPDRTLAAPTGRGGERWLDIRAWHDLAPVTRDRFRLCREKGFDAVVPGGPGDWAGATGLPLSRGDWERFGRRVAALAEQLGLRLVPPPAGRVGPAGDAAGTGDRSTTSGWRTAPAGWAYRRPGRARPRGRRPPGSGRTTRSPR